VSGYTHSGQVYFITHGAYVKIGYTSKHIAHRLHSLRTKSRLVCPADMDFEQRPAVLRLIPGCVMRDEARIHALFAAHHVIGEWYRLSPAFLRHLQRLEYVTDREVLSEFRRGRRELKQVRARRSAA
jgi:hypothetical protein